MTYYAQLALKLISLPKIGAVTAKKIIDNLSFRITSDSDFKDLLADSALNLKTPQFSNNEIQDALDKVEMIWDLSERAGIKIISIVDKEYPEKLKRLKKPPLILNYSGNINSISEKRSCAVIGTRSPTPHGYEYGFRIAKKFAEQNITVVSGLALGCDTAGHLGCLSGHGITVAVLAQGINIDKVYPKENRGLARQIVDEGGLLISEYTIDQSASQNFFVERDRIQAGISDFLFVVETGVKGGTMHTVRFAGESNIPIATYNHPEKYRSFEQTLGNQNLIAEKKADGVFSLEEVNSFLSKIYLNNQPTLNMKIDSEVVEIPSPPKPKPKKQKGGKKKDQGGSTQASLF